MVIKNASVFILFFTLVSYSYAAKSPLTSPKIIKRDILQFSKKISRLSKKIESLERKLENTNNNYLRLSRKKSSLSDNVKKIDEQLQKEQVQTSRELKKLKKRLHQVVMIEMGGLDSPEQVMALKVLKSDLSKKIKNLYRYKKETLTLQKSLSQSLLKVKEIERLQGDLIDVSEELEAEKKEKALSYIHIKNKRSQLKEDLKTSLKARPKTFKKRRSALGYFTSPIKKRVGLDYKKKGVTFLFSKSQPLLTTRSGKVIHIGSLSSYGNVIMIDHGNETRSVLLGDFKAKVKKGDQVKEGQVLGHSRLRSGQEGKVYFEVRKKNKVYKTINLIKV